MTKLGCRATRNIDETVKAIEVRHQGIADPDDRDSQLLQPDGSIRESEEQRGRLSARKIPDVSPMQRNTGNYKFDGSRTDAALANAFKTVIAKASRSPSISCSALSSERVRLRQYGRAGLGAGARAAHRHHRQLSPARFGLTRRDFNDDHHVTRGAVRRCWRTGCVT